MTRPRRPTLRRSLHESRRQAQGRDARPSRGDHPRQTARPRGAPGGAVHPPLLRREQSRRPAGLHARGFIRCGAQPLAPGPAPPARCNVGARLPPALRPARLAVDPYHSGNRHRRHAVPGRHRQHGAAARWLRRPCHAASGAACEARRARRAERYLGPKRRARQRRGDDAFRGHPRDRQRRPRGAARGTRAGARRRACGRGRLATDARAHRRDHRDPRGRAAAGDGGGTPGNAGLSALGGRRPFHLHGFPRLRSRRRGGRGRAASRGGLGPRCAARQRRCRHHLAKFRAHPGAAAGAGAGADAADHHQIHPRLDRTPSRAPRLHRHQTLRRRGRADRRMAIPRALQFIGLQRAAKRHSAAAQERRRLGLGLRKDLYGRFVTALVYGPRDRYHTELRRRIQVILMQAFDGQSVEFNIEMSESPLARVHFIIRTRPEHLPDYDRAELEARMVEAMLSWQDELQTALFSQLGEEQGAKLHRRYHDAFPPAYRDDYSPRTAAMDIQRLEALDATQPLVTHLYRPQDQDGALLRFKFYGSAEPMALSDALPMLERMGLRVLAARPYRITPRLGGAYWILDFDMIAGSARQVDVMEVKEFFQDTFIQLCSGGIENDGFNRLVLLAELHWRQVVVLRALCKYLLQTRIPFSQHYIEASLANHPAAVKLLVALFEACFDPGQQL